MKTTQIPKITGYRDGTTGAGWWVGDDYPRVRIRCPDGESVADLRNHTIAPDGKVTPSILVTGHDGLAWHIMGQLLGWPP